MSWNIWPQLSQLAEPLWTDPGTKNGISVRELISTKKKKKVQAGNEWSNVLPKILTSEEKATYLSPGVGRKETLGFTFTEIIRAY